MKKTFFFLAVTFFLNIYAVDIVSSNRPLAFILAEKNAPAPVRLAASEISSYAAKITGTSLPVGELREKKGHYVISFDIKKEPSLGPEGYRIEGAEKGLKITGNSPRGILYGAYAFIEEFFGVRWFAPGELYEHVPRKSSLSLPEKFIRTGKPEFSVRKAGFVRSNWNSELKETWKFLVRNRWQVKGNHRLLKRYGKIYKSVDADFSGGGHCLSSLIPDDLFDTHPEYFALVKGKRIRQIDDRGRAVSQPCTSHPEVIAIAVKKITEFFSNAPRNSSYLIGGNDVQVWCECSRCTALDTQAEREKGYVSTRFFTFVDAVAAGVRKKHPHAQILAWGYQNYRFAPEGRKPDPALRINLCTHQRCYRHSLLDNSCRQNDLFRSMFLSWKAHGVPLTERGYQETLLRNGYYYLPIENVIAHDLRYLRSIGADGYEFITTAPDGTYRKQIPRKEAETLKNAMYCLWPAVYVCGKMFWDTSLDPEKIWEEAGSCFYGKAWSPMKEYRKILRQIYAESSGHIIYGNPPVDIGRALQRPGVEKKLLALLKKAELLAAGDPDKKVAVRLAHEKKYFMETWIKNARLFEKTQSKGSSAGRISGSVIIDGKRNEKSWQQAEYIIGHPCSTVPPEQPADIFAKVLFDEKFIYLAIGGTQPADDEKWIISFPDHNDLTAPLKQFDLDGTTPFRKAKKTDGPELCYELRIPRKLMGLREIVAGFSFNARRMRSSRTCAVLYKTPLGRITLGKEGIKNGSFSQLKPIPSPDGDGRTRYVPQYWGEAGKGWSYKKGGLLLKGVMYQFLTVSGGKKGALLKVDVYCSAVSAKAFIQPYLSLCTRKPGDRRKFQHAIKKYGPRTAVGVQAVHHFVFELAPYEKGYIYLRGRNVFVRGIIAAVAAPRSSR